MNYAQHYSRRTTQQSEPIPGETQVQNAAGGYVYQIDKWQRMARFLLLGTEGGTYYVKERPLTKANAANVEACIAEDGPRAVKLIVDISDASRAPKNDPAVFALALAASAHDPATRRYALDALPKVCRIPTHLFHFAEACKQLRGWGRGLRQAIGAWYTSLPPEKLAYEVAKYQQRDGWSNADLLRKSHPRATNAAQNAVFRWVVDGMTKRNPCPFCVERTAHVSPTCEDCRGSGFAPLPHVIEAFEQAKTMTDPKMLCRLITDVGLTREMLPTTALTNAEVWDALLVKMPFTAMLRNLGNMSKVGLLVPMSIAAKTIGARLRDAERLKKARVHPISILVGMRTYGAGHGVRGSGEWSAVREVVDALDDAFYLAFGAIEATGQRLFLALDVSGSMNSAIGGFPLSCREATAALAMVTAKTEQQWFLGAFETHFTPLTVSPRQRLDDVVKAISDLNYGGTDCAQPMLYALAHGIQADAFCTFTDNETWAGSVHPSQALRQYREQTGIPAKMIVNGMTASDFSVADPNDAGSLDVCGFDTATPTVISEFVRG